METHQEKEQLPSPHAASYSPNTSTTSSTSSNGMFSPATAAAAPPPAPPPPTTPKPLPRSTTDPTNPYPTTFIQADTSSFKQVVQMLTGSAETAAKHATAPAAPPPKSSPSIPTAARPPGPKKPAFKLYERRGSFRHLKMISPLLPNFQHPPGSSPRKMMQQPEILSPSMLDLPSLVLSPVTPLISDPFNRCSPSPLSEEDRAIAEKGFYLHPSPRMATPTPPRLLPLFPVTSPRVSSPPSFHCP